MKEDYMEKALDEISDSRIMEAAETKKKKSRRPWYLGAVAAVLVLALGLGVLLRPGDGLGLTAMAVGEPEYPAMAQRPRQEDYYNENGPWDVPSDYYAAESSWWADRQRQAGPENWYQGELDGFWKDSIRQFLSQAGEENCLYSPLNVYMALAMLAETTEGQSRQEILDVLGAEDIESLRTQAKLLWNANYCDDGSVTSLLASSLWLNEDVSFHQSAIKSLTENYFASVYQGNMGDAAMSQALRDWLNAQTKNKLEEKADKLSFKPDTVMALATTAYFKGGWDHRFSKEKTAPQVFHGAQGDVTVDFMHQSVENTYYWGAKFSAVNLNIDSGGKMRLILPDEDVTIDELLADEEAMEFALSSDGWKNSKSLIVNLSMPKFDVSASFDLKEGLQALGVQNVFDDTVSNFTPLTETDGLFVSEASHAARVTVDEEGCEAASFTVLFVMPGACPPPDDEVDFVLDRPFLFVLEGLSGQPLFVGVVNQPGVE